MNRNTGRDPLILSGEEGEQSFASVSSLLRAAVGEKATSRQIARIISDRGAGSISHQTIAAVLRGEAPSDATLYALSLAFDIPLNRLREAAGRPMDTIGTISAPGTASIIYVPDIAAMLGQISPDDWAALNATEREMAVRLTENHLRAVIANVRQTIEATRATRDEEALCAA